MADEASGTRSTSSGAGSRGAAGGGAEVVASAEQLEVATRWVPSGRVRVAKQVVTEERTVRVAVRREVLVVERLDAEEGDADGGVGAMDGTGATGAAGWPAAADGEPVVEMVLSEEEVRTEVVVVPRERVRVFLERVTGSREVSADLAREVVDVDAPPAP